MKHNRWTILIVALIAIGYFVSQAVTQAPPSAAPAPLPSLVAVVDVAQLIKRHPDFKAKQEALQGEMLAKEAYFKEKQEKIAAKERGFAALNLRQNSPEHTKAMDEIQSDYAEFDREAKAEQRRFVLKNSHIMYDTYKEIKLEIGKFARSKGIAQVTDFREFEPDPTIPSSVAEDMDQKLVWFDSRLDVTEHILAQMCAARTPPVPVPPKEVPGANTQRTATNTPPPASSFSGGGMR